MELAPPQRDWLRGFAWAWLQVGGAWAGILLGLAVVVSWHTSGLFLLGAGWDRPLAGYSAGWMMILSGMALEMARKGWKRTPSFLAALMVCIGGFSLSQLGTGFAWSPESAFFKNPAWEVLGPALMSPTTSVCAVAFGASLLLNRSASEFGRRLAWMLALGVAIMATVSLAGYVTGLPLKANWGAVHVLFMSFLSALGFFALALGLLARQMDPGHSPAQGQGWPVTIFTLGCIATLVTTQALTIQRDQNLVRTVQAESLSLQSRIRGECESRLVDLAGMARRWAFRPPSEAEWDDDVSQYVGEHSGTVFLEWVDPSMMVKRLSPLKGRERWVGLDVKMLEEKKRRPYQLANAQGAPQVSGSFPILESRQLGMIMVAPIPRNDSRGGYLVGVVYVTTWLNRAISDPRYYNYGVTILEEGRPIFERAVKGDGRGVETCNLELPGVTWQLKLVPGPGILAQHQNTLAKAILGAGLLFSGLMAFLAQLARKARIRQEGFKASEARLRAVFDASPAGIVVLDREGRHTQWNQAWSSFLGYSSEELGRMTVMDLGLPEERETVEARLEAVFNGRVSGYAFERSYVRKDGEIVWGSVATSGLLEREGALVSILLVVQDITKRRSAEDALRRTQANLEDAQRLAHIGSWEWDIASGALTWSTEQFRIFGEDPETYVPSYEGYLSHLSEVERENIGRVVQSAIEACGNYSIEHAITLSDGRVRTLFEQGQVALGADRRPNRMFGTTQDITERKKLERLREDFVSVVSHELRTPLTSIRGSLGLLWAFFGERLNEKGQELLQISTRNCDRLVLLINDLLDIQKIESGNMAFVFQREDLRSLVEEGVRANEGFVARHGLGFRKELPLDPVWVRADRHRLIQVVTNLLSNAAKFGGEAKPVEVRLESRDGWARLEIQDHGDGISEGFQDRIFQKFAQADEGTTRASGGTGLGLSIVKAIVEHHGGQVGFKTQLGEGTTFFVELRLLEALGSEAPSTVAPV